MRTLDRSLEQRLADLLADEAPRQGADALVDAVLARTRTHRPRRRWLILMRESPMRLDRRPVFGSVPVRATATLVVTLLLALLAVGTAVVGASLLTPSPAPVIPPERGVFTPTEPMAFARERPAATLLSDGRVLVTGGYGDSESSAELWDPRTGVFIKAGELTEARWGHTATLLRDGRVLIVGGGGPDGVLASTEIWDPATMSSTVSGSLAAGREGASAMLLPDGRVLLTGGTTSSGDEILPAEVWDPTTGTFSEADSLPEARYPAGTLLDDGKVLVFGGDISVPGDTVTVRGPRSATVWDPATGATTPAGSLTAPHGLQFTTTVLLDGRVLVVGGDGCPRRGSCGPVAVTEIWDPATMSFSATGHLGQARMYHAAALLHDGRVLVVGDRLGGRGDTAEVFGLR